VVNLFKKIKRFNDCNEKNKKYILFLAFLLSLFIFIIYLLINIRYHAPVTLSDEAGYLTKAMALSGIKVDAASSYFGGYSLMILPAFLLSHDPSTQWSIVMILNSLMWAISAGLLFLMLKKYFPKKSSLVVATVTALTLLYPGFISISSYSLATSGFVLILMLALTVLIKSDFRNPRYLLLFSLLAGYLFWVHPLGLVFVAVSIICLIARAILCEGFKKYLPSILLMVFMTTVYLIAIHPWFNNIMTPIGLSIRNHYNDFYVNIFLRASNVSYFIYAFTFFIGQISFLLVATFGVVVFCVDWLFGGRKRRFYDNLLTMIKNETLNLVLLMVVLSIIITAVVEALYFPADLLPFRFAQWVYGRYVEMFLMPVIGVGLLSKWRLKPILWACVFAIFTGIIFTLVINKSNTTFYYVWEASICTFWPLVVFLGSNYLFWFVAGSIGMIYVAYTGTKNQKWLGLLVSPLLIFSLIHQSNIHLVDYYAQHGREIISRVIGDNYKPGSCVGFDERVSSYTGVLQYYSYFTFRLSNYKTMRMLPGEWAKKCDGPFLTYNTDFIKDTKGAKIIVQDKATNIFLVTRQNDISLSYKMPIDRGSLKYFTIPDEPIGCKINSYPNWNALVNDPSVTQVGGYVDGRLNTKNREGYLLIAPKTLICKGVYDIKFNLDIKKQDLDSRLKITSRNASLNHLIVYFDNYPNKREFAFQLGEDTSDLQIMIYVGQDAQMSLSSYSIRSINGS
jgi:hypothetical protein